MKLQNIIIAAFAVILMASCSISMPVAATSNKMVKEGVATRTIWFGISIGHTNVGIEQAAKNGGITKVATVDYTYKAGLFKSVYTTTVTGE